MDHHDSTPPQTVADGDGDGEAIASFGPTHIVQPRSDHTHTAIVLHGRGSSGDEFAEEFFDSTLSDGRTLRDRLPGWRWVFPSSKELWSTAFEEYMPAWFEAHSLTDPTTRQDLQVGGLVDSVEYVRRLIEAEIGRLGGNPRRLVLGGISQGGAVGIWALLSLQSAVQLGGFFAASTWLPFAADVKNLLFAQGAAAAASERGFSGPESTESRDRVLGMIPPSKTGSFPRQTPVFIGHGSDDVWVDIELGRQAADVLGRGWNVTWREYTGAEEEGHWFKIPEEMDDIHTFLLQVAGERL